MNKLKIRLLACAMIAGCPILPAQNPVGNFQEFRKGLLDDFQEFKARILEHYADFLEGEWHEYEPLEPLKRNERPKPDSIPNVEKQIPVKEGQLAVPNYDKTKLSKVAAAKSLKKSTNAIFNPSARGVSVIVKNLPAPVRNDRRSSSQKTTGADEPKDSVACNTVDDDMVADAVAADSVAALSMPDIVADATVTADSVAEESPVIDYSEATIPPKFDFMPASGSREGMDFLNFYNMEILVPKMDFSILESIPSPSHFGRQWRHLDEQRIGESVSTYIRPVVENMGLSDYLTYEFMVSYAKSKFPGADASARASLVHYLLANLGYDVRIGVLGSGEPAILINSVQTIYAVPRVELGGTIYCIYTPDGGNIETGIRTCDIPEAASGLGRQFDYTLAGLNLPLRQREYDLDFGKIRIRGVVNENIYPVLYRYPQMETGDYAASDVLPDVKADVARQVREQLAGLPPQEAVNELLHFVQNRFNYSTDTDLHGFEKPYFFEENLYYPTNDCEDRAIFYTYLLWNALDVENHLLQYPEHESASVCLPDVHGMSYLFNGKKYYISDPTYIGANTGQCMPAYINVSPEIDYVYPLE